MQKILDQLKTNFAKQGGFKPFIDFIRFPRFRNLEPDTKINFKFPVSVFVGQNGCGKSSVLQALYGSPKGKNVSDFWFNTEVDPIVEMAGDNRNCLIYSYDRGGAATEVLKRRIAKQGKPDLWDTSEPIARYGMTAGAARVPPVEMNVVYLNFRVGQSAFEKAFHEETPPRSGIQAWLREKSTSLNRVLRGGKFRPFGHVLYDAKHNLTPQEIGAMSMILGRTYTAAILLKHKLYGAWGYSVFFDSAHAKYSEAFAGSGETNVAFLVHQLISAPRNSLVLLDEPEISLHPGAQKRLLEFILEQALAKAHQVVICTHSSALVALLPSEAIKVFHVTATGAFRVKEDVRPYEAFHFLGEAVPVKRTLIVEDRLALLLLEAVLALDAAKSAMVGVQHFFGGASAMKQDAAVYMRENPRNRYLVLDGTEKPATALFNPGTITEAQMANPTALSEFLDGEIKAATGARIAFATDSGTGNKAQKCQLQCDYLRYLSSHVYYLPFDAPEDVLWDDDYVKRHLDLIFDAPEVAAFFASLAGEKSKQKFAAFAKMICDKDTAADINVIHRMVIKQWMRDTRRSGPTITAIKSIIDGALA